MVSKVYPEQLPLPNRSGYGLKHVSPLQRTQLQSGRARQRRKFTSVPTIVTVTWQFSSGEAQLFEGWYRYGINDGADWFQISMLTPLGLQTSEARFTDIYQGPQPMGMGLWIVSAEIEMRERKTISEEWIDTPELLVNASVLDIAINDKWPTQ
jgi:hypothetical protein